MGSPLIFAGTDAKSLKSNIDLAGGAKILSGAADPTSTATDAPKGSLYLSTNTGKLYKKTDAGSSTNWTEIQTTATSVSSVITGRTTNYTMTASDDILEGDVSGGSFTVTLPTASSDYDGKYFTITLTTAGSTNALTVTDGTYSMPLYTAGESVTVFCDGSAWKTQYHYIPSVDTNVTTTWTGSTSAPSKGNSGSPTTDRIIWWRKGQFMYGRLDYQQSNATGAATGSGVMMLTVPNSWTIDTTNLTAPASLSDGKGIATQLGKGVIGNDANTLNTAYQAGLFYYDSTHLYIQYQLNNSNQETFTSTSTILFTAANLHMSFSFKIPISGWKQ